MWPFRKRDPRPRRGDTIISIDARGCMATDWRVRWVGRVERVDSPDGLCGRAVSWAHYRIDLQPGGGRARGGNTPTANLTPVSPGVWAEIV